MDTSQILDLGLFAGGTLALFKYAILPSGRWVANYIERTTKGFAERMDELTRVIIDEGRMTRVEMKAKKLTDEQIIGIGFAYIRSSSFEKIDYLEKILIRNDIVNRKSEITHSIREKLQTISQDGYVNKLNEFTLSTGEKFGDWVSENFRMEHFLEKLCSIFFSEGQREAGTDIIRHRKINEIRILMFFEQTKLKNKCNAEILNKGSASNNTENRKGSNN
jgi:hypothetical protein